MSAPALPVDERSPPSRGLAKPAHGLFGARRCQSCGQALASLKLTVVLFAFGIFVVSRRHARPDRSRHLAGRPRLFPRLGHVGRCQPALSQVVLPRSCRTSARCPLFPLPGGMTVGVLMAVNLLAAHGWRFKMQASGARLLAGPRRDSRWACSSALVIIWAGHNSARLSGQAAVLVGRVLELVPVLAVRCAWLCAGRRLWLLRHRARGSNEQRARWLSW